VTTEAVVPPSPKQGRWHFEWLLQLIFKPRATFQKIIAQGGANWQVPILVLLVTALLEVFAAGYVRQSVAATGEIPLPPGYEYYTPGQQAQYMQAMSSTTSPVFVYVLPALLAAGKVLIGWLLVGGILHLVLTLLGGRGDTGTAMNLVAWSGLPFAVRSFVRAVVIIIGRKLISSPGLSGFISPDGTNTMLFLSSLLSLVDIFLIWHWILLVIGVRVSTGLSRAKVIGGVFFTQMLILLVQVLINFGMSQLSDLTIIRPFF
jgi:hypothetical protein